MVRSEQVMAQKKNDQKKKQERGASLVEYALLVALIAGAAIVGIQAVGTSVDGRLNTVAGQIAN